MSNVTFNRPDRDAQFKRLFAEQMAHAYMDRVLKRATTSQRRMDMLTSPTFHYELLCRTDHRWQFDVMTCADCGVGYEQFADSGLKDSYNPLKCRPKPPPPIQSALIDILLQRDEASLPDIRQHRPPSSKLARE